MNTNHEDKLIRDIFEQVQTPSYDVSSDVLKRILSIPRKRVAIKRVAIVAAALCVSFALLRAAKLIGWQSFNFFGETREYDDNPLVSNAEHQDPDHLTKYDNTFLSEAVAGEVRLVIVKDEAGGGACIGPERTNDWDKINSFAKYSNRPMELPSYIPAGYALTEGVIEFYPDADSLQSEMVSSEVLDGKTYETYKLPADYGKNVCGLSLYYADEGGNVLTYRVQLMSALGENNSINFGAPGNAVSEKIEVYGFDAAILILDKAKNNGMLSSGKLYKEIPSIDAVDIFSLSSTIQQNRVLRFGDDASNTTYSAVVYSIDAENLGKEEIIRIAESIQ